MAIRVIEHPKQAGTVQFKSPDAKREYAIYGTLVKTEALIALLSTAPSTDSGVDATGAIIPIFLNKISINEIGGGAWNASVDYVSTPNQYDLKFNIGVQSTKYHQALEHIRTYDCVTGNELDGPGSMPGIPDFKGAIGVNADKVDGADVEVGKVDFTITKKFLFSVLSAVYVSTIMNMTPSVNDDVFAFTFKGQIFAFPRGSVLFRGASLSVNSDSEVEIQLMFSFQKPLVATAPEWDSTTTYAAADQVLWEGDLFSSAAGGNLDNEPVTVAWNPLITYAFADKVRWNGGGGTHIYASLLNGNVNQQPDLVPGDWQDDGTSPWNWLGPDPGELRIGNSGPIIKEGWWYMWPWYKPQVAAGNKTSVPRAVVIDRVYSYGNFTSLDI